MMEIREITVDTDEVTDCAEAVVQTWLETEQNTPLPLQEKIVELAKALQMIESAQHWYVEGAGHVDSWFSAPLLDGFSREEYIKLMNQAFAPDVLQDILQKTSEEFEHHIDALGAVVSTRIEGFSFCD